jgi:hypothetical protein
MELCWKDGSKTKITTDENFDSNDDVSLICVGLGALTGSLEPFKTVY